MNEKWFLNDVSQIEKKLKTNAASGLSRKAARSAFRAKANAYGKLFINKKKSLLEMLKELLSDFALILLLLCAIMALLFDELHLGATTLIFCIDTLFVSFIFYYRSQRALEQVDFYFMPTAKVIRGGKLYRISFDNVVPGDVILLEKGDIVCGDARLVLSDDLGVDMRISENEYIPLRKHSGAIVAPNENNPCNFANILHAGSIITQGSARAIVYATGTYTYLGAKTGGIHEKRTDDVPKELKKLKAICSKISMISMLCVLPFCIISLLFSNVRGGTVTLSASFLTALAICASAMTQLCYTLCKSFFVHKIKSLANAPSPVALRSTNALDKIRNLTHLFMIDGCAVTDGILHFESAFTGEGEQVDINNLNNPSKYLLELAALYNIAESSSVSLGIGEPGKYKIGLDEMMSAAKIDASALKIRCPIKSYMQTVTADAQSIIAFSDMGREATISVADNIDVIAQCKTVLTPDGIRPFSAFAIDRAKHTLGVQHTRGKQVLIFMLSADHKNPSDTDKCLAGAIVLGEGVDHSAKKAIATLRSGGVKVISFVDSKGNFGPEIPDELYGSVRILKDELIKKKLPITYRLGEIETYSGFDKTDISALCEYIQKNGGSVGVLGFSDYASDAINNADVFMTCAPIINVFSTKDEKELFELESVGRGMGTVCEQTLKRKADVLFARPGNNGRGGIKALLSVFSATNRALQNISDFITYLLTVQLIRIICVAFPMIFGTAILDARHILLYGLLCDVPMLLLLSAQSAPRRVRQPLRTKSLDTARIFNKKALILATAISLITIVLPEIVGLVGMFGAYLYPVEYMFSAVLWLHLATMITVLSRNGKSPKSLIFDKKYASYFAFVIIFLILVAAVTPAGIFIDWIKLPAIYLICSFVPSLILLLSEYFLRNKMN